MSVAGVTERLTVGFLPLVDAALPILAKELGFAEQEGLDLELVRDMSWATVLDRLLYGHSDAAHMLAPLAIATTLGRGRPARRLSVPFVLGLNGNAITVSTELADRLNLGEELADPLHAGQTLKAEIARLAGSGRTLRFGVVHRYSSHNYMLRYWLGACGISPADDVEIVTIAPPYAADALGEGEVDGICVGEPWNSVAVEQGAGRILLATAQVWRRGVEKVLAVQHDRLEARPEVYVSLLRALYRAGRHFVDPANWEGNANILSQPQYLDGSADLIQRAMSDRILLRKGAEPVHFADFMFQHREAANFPWVSQAQWLYSQMCRWDGMGFDAGQAELAAGTFRPDFYRRALSGMGVPLPGASSKLEGAVDRTLPVGSTQGSLSLGQDVFFDRQIFDPDQLESYISRHGKMR